MDARGRIWNKKKRDECSRVFASVRRTNQGNTRTKTSREHTPGTTKTGVLARLLLLALSPAPDRSSQRRKSVSLAPNAVWGKNASTSNDIWDALEASPNRTLCIARISTEAITGRDASTPHTSTQTELASGNNETPSVTGDDDAVVSVSSARKHETARHAQAETGSNTNTHVRPTRNTNAPSSVSVLSLLNKTSVRFCAKRSIAALTRVSRACLACWLALSLPGTSATEHTDMNRNSASLSSRLGRARPRACPRPLSAIAMQMQLQCKCPKTSSK